MKKIYVVFMGLIVSLFLFVGPLRAGQLDTLVNKLVEKGILSEEEGREVLVETRAELKEEIKKEMELAKAESSSKWSDNISLKGDLRVRWQHQQGGIPGDNKDQGRYRFRLGVSAVVTEDVSVHAGLATGGANPRSTNQTFQNNFDTPDIRSDYAYALYTPSMPSWDFLTVKGGKIKSTPWWHPSDFLWDGDINPEGGSLEMVWEGLTSDEDLDIFLNTGIFVLEGFATSDDPYMYVIQPGFNWDMTQDIHWKNAVTYYGFEEQKHTAWATAPGIGGTNTLTAAGAPEFDYDSVAVGSELVFDEMFEDWPRIAFLGEFIQSFDPGSRDKGWLAGVKIGDKKVKKQGQWQLYYNYRFLEQDAWPDVFPDADVYTGATDVKGHEVIVQYGLRDNVIFGLDYYYSEPISNGSRNPSITPAMGVNHLLQADVLFKF